LIGCKSLPANRLDENLDRLVALFLPLSEAFEFALSANRSPWDFAVEILMLQDSAASRSYLRWLMCKGFVHHALEDHNYKKEGRSFIGQGSLHFTERSCFILTKAGSNYARSLGLPRMTADVPAIISASDESFKVVPSIIPEWDADRRKLLLDGTVVKQFPQPSPNQVLVLVTFQDDGWLHRIDNPLSPRPDQDAQQRLHDTIVRLNRHQQNRLICFRGDGTGEGVCWELIAPMAGGATPETHQGQTRVASEAHPSRTCRQFAMQ
jgi:hypothetical protein